jgi:hypothetical protein
MIQAYWRWIADEGLHGFPDDWAGPTPAFPVFPPINPEKAPQYLKHGARSYHCPKFPPIEGGGLIWQSEKQTWVPA